MTVERYEARVVPIPTGVAIVATARPDRARYGARPGSIVDGTLLTIDSGAVLLDLFDRLHAEAGRPTLASREADDLARLRDAIRHGIDTRRRAALAPKRNPETKPPAEWITVKAAADRLGCSTAWVRSLARAERLTADRDGPRGHWRIDPDSVADHEAKRATP